MRLLLCLALAQDPHDLDSLKAAILNRNWSEADALSERCLRGRPDSPEVLHLRGHVLNRLERYEAALPLLRRAGELGRVDGPFLLDLGMALLHAGAPEDAVAALTKAADALSAPAPAIYFRGHAHVKRKAWADAIADFDRAAELEPKLKQPCDLFAAQALQAQGQDEDAARRARSAREGPLSDVSRAADLLRGFRLGPLGPEDYRVSLRLGYEPVENATFIRNSQPVIGEFGRRNDWRSVVGLDAGVRPWRPGRFELELSDSFTMTRYHDLEEFNSDLNVAAAELSWRDGPWSARLRPEWAYELKDSDPFSSEWSVGAGASCRHDASLSTSVDLRLSQVDYYAAVGTSELDRDGRVVRLTGALLARSPSLADLRARLHLSLAGSETEGAEYDGMLFETGLAVLLELPLDVTLSSRLVFQWNRYEDPSAVNPLGPRRHDFVMVAGAELARQVAGPAWLVLAWNRIDNDSNTDAWSYATSWWTFGVELRQ
jgi:tetratricopeptide (TPR) repeat protein